MRVEKQLPKWWVPVSRWQQPGTDHEHSMPRECPRGVPACQGPNSWTAFLPPLFSLSSCHSNLVCVIYSYAEAAPRSHHL